MNSLKLGVIGMSSGNGHPYSWSAIFNGYDSAAMADCGFPVIPAYLAEQTWPDARIPNVQVTHIWTQDKALSQKVAAATHIPNVTDTLQDMVGKVDALLLARDDAENHFEFAKPFLEAGFPVYIDKPVALSRTNLDALFDLAQNNAQIFSCSALRYAPELMLSDSDRHIIGDLRRIVAQTPKYWQTYGVHAIDPIIAQLPEGSIISRGTYSPLGNGGAVVTAHVTEGPDLIFVAAGEDVACPIEIQFMGSAGTVTKTFHDSFTAFRTALAEFVKQIRTGQAAIPRKQLELVVDLIQAGEPK